MNKEKTIIFSMPNTHVLAQEICDELKMKLHSVNKTIFADGEVLLSSKETVRSKDVFIVASTSHPANNNIMDLLIFVDSLKRASAKTINVILSYYGYARQDRKAEGRQPIAAKLLADLLQVAGISRIVVVDLHNPSIQGFFNIPVDDIKAQYILSKEFTIKDEKFTIVSPDHGGTIRARIMAEIISNDVKIAIIDKRRVSTNKTEVLGVIGDINNENAVIVDDIIDTGGTIVNAAEVLKKNGAKKISIVASHGIFSKGFDIFEDADVIDEVIVTNSIDNYELAKKYKKLKIVSLAPFLSKVIRSIMDSKSVSDIYAKYLESK
ncbi:RIBOSE-PHOSPHATE PYROPHOSPHOKINASE (PHOSPHORIBOSYL PYROPHOSPHATE SYNTHETASE) [Mycoplasmopsis pulmonis]|uniref:Ribose-phosphate pyrophosphokinase n=1 Tax=Mycoplasmopsis pulmonis (strain UAB CTIP) TaxID=272635 RepID=KPRS_MYCPU|nr:ribose-phosphate pyrophosphokinase [Mycoplasmopsis pulmonis]Q98R83.1 RecName: Full=Ribose-phosphate pyrophosphokinase; Short=RPPK; AltName: Full=5-phospho-D-ribosyl alpha-1-diphosphate synthase; AltName: Full=Phosphoribosyl diphosphate synthase; AltName: Full=Phosphoribosyl pyrophosphate synthase; Short=P-Rib-PP synthase; Short=PRPP synthase; Short=PRPPase [Mycoplasmopsis pulmonis UAB CTIP]MDZ7293097.1 ribose-phosphate pyrophosphokinase [Mycoplasmopsis pulmonis]CAC13300.1 RIBOSE-PHOSPHATE PYR